MFSFLPTVSLELAVFIQLRLVPLEAPLLAYALDGSLLCRVTHCTPPLSHLMSGNHSKQYTFYVIDSPQLPIIIGYPW